RGVPPAAAPRLRQCDVRRAGGGRGGGAAWPYGPCADAAVSQAGGTPAARGGRRGGGQRRARGRRDGNGWDLRRGGQRDGAAQPLTRRTSAPLGAASTRRATRSR